MGLERLRFEKCDHTGGGHIIHSPYCDGKNIIEAKSEVEKTEQTDTTFQLPDLGFTESNIETCLLVAKTLYMDDPIPPKEKS